MYERVRVRVRECVCSQPSSQPKGRNTCWLMIWPVSDSMISSTATRRRCTTCRGGERRG